MKTGAGKAPTLIGSLVSPRLSSAAWDRIKCQWIHYEIVNLITRRLAIVIIIAAISIGLLLQFMLWRIGVDWIAAILGLAAVGILVIAGLEFPYELCHVPDEKM